MHGILNIFFNERDLDTKLHFTSLHFCERDFHTKPSFNKSIFTSKYSFHNDNLLLYFKH